MGTILLGDKFGASVHWKFLPLLHDFGSIRLYSWGSACLVHLYRSLCRASCFNCKKIDGPLTLLLAWVWIRLPYLAPVPRKPRSFSLSNRYNHILTELPVLPQHPLDIYMHWYRTKYGNHLNLSNLVVQENDEDAGQSQSNRQPDFMLGRYSLDARHPCCTSSGVSKGLVSGDSSRSDDSRGILNSQKPWHVSMSLIEENAKTVEHETNEYLIDEPDDEDEMTRKVKMRTWMRIKNPAMMLLMMVIMQVEF
ncbi:hypothetical protein Ahy_A09g043344 [Arachis hypogaea]|uniref:Aminotransferase-like plant mobile domain-containing protein n=1 Tax=Arachis hypogaea TaxID=3818 RepID=A0A445BI36_ARAHY|nr:hypothetical protein Ahy_A09g043344 [Arachis hypogaea]